MRELLLGSFQHALSITHPGRLSKMYLPQPPDKGRLVVLAVGKAALPMLRAAEEVYGERAQGFGVTRYGHGGPTRFLPLLEAGHPLPDDRSRAAANRALALALSLGPGDLLVVLISGGGSALLSAPWGIDPAHKQELTRQLLASGAGIAEMNAVRKHLSLIKGGRLAQAAYPARVVSLVLSDVPGDDLSVVASGPTMPDESSFAQALAVLDRYRITAPAARRHFAAGLRGELEESPSAAAPCFERTENRLIGCNQDFLTAARAWLEQAGLRAVILSDLFQGPAGELARFHAALAGSIRHHHNPFAPPVVLLSGGEAAVRLRQGGKGGRNQEFALWLAQWAGPAGLWGLACDTDGIDGNSDAAGALIAPDSLDRARTLGLDPAEALRRHHSQAFFDALGDLVRVGPTQNNLNDYRAVFVEPG